MGLNRRNYAERINDTIRDTFQQGQVDVTLRYSTRTNTYAFLEAATHHERPVTSENTWTCQATGLWVMGAIETIHNGSEVDIVLNEMFCDNVINERYHITGMPIFTATAQSESPVVITTSMYVQDAGTTPSTTADGVSMDDILQGRVSTRPPVGTVKILNARVRVRCWQLNGQPAPNVDFAWTCLAEGVITTKQ